MSTSMIWIRALNMHKKSEIKTYTSKPHFLKFMSRLTAFLKTKNKEVLKKPAEETEALKDMGVLK
tara:strand:+ start:649 stop:843 length:195 start_codon:yes stop_codon:yes gene_type:complete